MSDKHHAIRNQVELVLKHHPKTKSTNNLWQRWCGRDNKEYKLGPIWLVQKDTDFHSYYRVYIKLYGEWTPVLEASDRSVTRCNPGTWMDLLVELAEEAEAHRLAKRAMQDQERFGKINDAEIDY